MKSVLEKRPPGDAWVRYRVERPSGRPPTLPPVRRRDCGPRASAARPYVGWIEEIPGRSDIAEAAPRRGPARKPMSRPGPADVAALDPFAFVRVAGTAQSTPSGPAMSARVGASGARPSMGQARSAPARLRPEGERRSPLRRMDRVGCRKFRVGVGYRRGCAAARSGAKTHVPFRRCRPRRYCRALRQPAARASASVQNQRSPRAGSMRVSA